MKKRELLKLISEFHSEVEINVICGFDEDGSPLYTGGLIVDIVEASEASGIDPDGTPREATVKAVIIRPEDGPWASSFDDEEEEGDA